MYKFFTFLVFTLFCFGNCSEGKKLPDTQPATGKTAGIVAFYNVENLFDTENDPNISDEEFLPGSKQEWTPDRYQVKLAKLAQVLDSVGQGSLPALTGLAEIENEKVLKDLLVKAKAQQTHAIVHYNSPDQRGIDVALLYNKSLFTPVQSEPLKVVFDFDPKITTRDILYVNGTFKGETLHLLVNHWPSRRDGEKESEPKRMAAAAVARKKLDQIFAANPKAKVILMGDFNDEPHNNSITKGLQAQITPPAAALPDNALYDLMGKLETNGQGSYNHQGDWNMLDQFIVSGALLNAAKGLRLGYDDARIYNADWIMYTNSNGQKMPNKTYGGTKYYGGYSDHLPVYLRLRH
ncbi:hypothetical protein C7N43_30900 [Sphingobacteriales bacterium UPWRP_1]|nr:hypothetical protein BVG80_18785 [Sphingobacteriales bacterium TSM_CSM]PSJ73092.1 hypothetical protein C7N43_30900 [Sphingobacteriales bacterium UPWRP_1]